VPAVKHSRGERAALRYARLGWRVLPLHTPGRDGACSCGLKACPKPGKHPRTRHGVRDASASAETISLWWTTWPDANIGLATGALLVVDVDGADGERALRQLAHEHDLPVTLKGATGRGCHLYFAAPTVSLGNSSGRLGHGLDIRGRGGYVVAPPSLHALGHRYRWTNRRRPARLPAWIHELLTTPASPPSTTLSSPPRDGSRRRPYLTVALRCEVSDVARAERGTRNNTLNRAAFRLGQLARPDDATLADIESYLLDAALAAGLTEREALATIDSGLRAGQQYPR
jgi:hypothetical protein